MNEAKHVCVSRKISTDTSKAFDTKGRIAVVIRDRDGSLHYFTSTISQITSKTAIKTDTCQGLDTPDKTEVRKIVIIIIVVSHRVRVYGTRVHTEVREP